MAYRRINSWPPNDSLPHRLPLHQLAANALNINRNSNSTQPDQKYNPKSLFQLSSSLIWSHKSFSRCKCFTSHFSCIFCYKALLTMHDEYISLSDIMSDSNENIVVDYYEYNPTKLHNPSYLTKFERVTFMTNDLYVLKKFIVLHCMYQNKIKTRISLPIYLYGFNYYLHTGNVRMARYLNCKCLVSSAFNILSKRNPDLKVKIVAFKSVKTKGQILNTVARNVNIIILLLVLIVLTLIFVIIVKIIDSFVDLNLQ